MKRILLLVIFTLSLATIWTLSAPQQTHALSGSEFQAGNIIDDGMFYNGGNLTPHQIQWFLNSKVPTCDTYHARSTSPNDSGAPYTCLKDYRQDTWSIPGDSYCSGFSGGNKSAADIIYEVGVSCGINPKVILVTLQKEQSFITDTWPWAIQYEKATGFGCPDNPPSNWPTGCDPNYTGFFRQVYYGARQFKRYALDAHIFTSYRPYRNNFIQYHPNSGCGGTNVYIQNQATSSLYIYTPYQPNAAALSNLYGTGDGCSAYGNRNFWRLFNDWFGSTHSPNFSWQPAGQAVYTNSAKSSLLGWDATLTSNQMAYAVVKARNTGNVTWANSGQNPVRLASSRPNDRTSPFCTTGWVGCGARAANLVESSVAPGQIGTFEFPILAPRASGSYLESFNLVAEGLSWFGDPGQSFTFNVLPQQFSWQPAGQGVYSDSSKTTSLGWDATLTTNQTAYAVVKARNTGNFAWTKTGPDAVQLGTESNKDRHSSFCANQWQSCNRPAMLQESVVAPGEIGTFEFPVTAPRGGGSYRESFNLVGYQWFGSPGQSFTFNVLPQQFSWQPAGQGVYTNSSKSVLLGWNANLTTNQTAYAVVKARNTGNFAWTKTSANPVRLGTSRTNDRISLFCNSGWLGCGARASIFTESVVAPGEIGTFEFPVTAPSTPGSYLESFNLVAEGLSWFGDPGQSFTFNVSP